MAAVSPAKELLVQLRALDFQVTCNVREYPSQCANFKNFVGGIVM
jgi:hypothetical protein